MNAKEMWEEYKLIRPEIGDEIDAWAFGAELDLLAQLVLEGTKTATASAFDEYLHFGEDLPKVGELDVVLDSQDNAVCIIETTRVYTLPFKDVPASHAFLEGEGDRSLNYWRQVHEELFTEWLGEIGITFSPDSQVVLEEFKVVYPL